MACRYLPRLAGGSRLLPRLAVGRCGGQGVGEPGRERRDLAAAGDAVAAVAADGAGGNDVSAVAAGVDLPAEPAGGVAQRGAGGHAEVQVPATARYRRFDLEIAAFVLFNTLMR